MFFNKLQVSNVYSHDLEWYFICRCKIDERLACSKESQQIQDRNMCSELEQGPREWLWCLRQMVEGSDTRVLLYNW